MSTKPFPSGPHAGAPPVVVRVAAGQWHALDDDLVVGRGYVQRRADGRLFVSVDAWHDTVFDLLADAMLAALPGPLFTVVDEADDGLTACWRRAGFAVRRREWEYAVPTDPRLNGPDGVLPPSGVRVLSGAQADEGLLRAVDREIRDEVEAGPGWWQSMPAEVIPRPEGDTLVDPSLYTVAAGRDRYLGLVRVVRAKRPRIGLVAVLGGEQRRGIARALLAHVLGALHRSGVETAWAEVHESNRAGSELCGRIGARPVCSNLELVR